MKKSKKILCIAVFSTFLCGCETPNFKYQNFFVNNFQYNKNQYSNGIWNRLCNNFQLQIPKNNKKVETYTAIYSKQAHHFLKTSKYASPYLYHIVEQIEEQNMPGELALLPMIESAYKPFAVSKVGASGIWQIGKTTGKRYGLRQDHWYDGRKDIAASTQAALEYLKFLYKEFDNDWYLALAAYNAGEGRIKRAIANNKKASKATDFWSLQLPKQTQDFVPKLLALANIIKNPNNYDIQLHPIDNKPYFVAVKTASQIDLNVAAKLAQVDIKELKQLNPGYNKFITHPEGPHQILLPTKNIAMFYANMTKMANKPLVTFIPHIISKGETLDLLAKKYKTTVPDIKHVNKLKSDVIILGKELVIPVKAMPSHNKPKNIQIALEKEQDYAKI